MPSTKTFAMLCAASLAAMIGISAVATALGVSLESGPAQLVGIAVMFGLFMLFGLSAIALMVKLVLAGQVQIGNADVGVVSALRRHETRLILGFWALILLGLVIAIPAAILDGALGPEATEGVHAYLRGGSRGTLVADVGMTIDAVRTRSSLALREPVRDNLVGALTLTGDVPFDFEVAGSGLRLVGCRYFFLSTHGRGDDRIESMSIGVSAHKVSKAELEEEHRALRQRLEADGWASGHFVYATQASRTLHGGATTGGEGDYWLKGETLLHVLGSRIDEWHSTDDANAGEWIEVVELWSRDTSSTYRDLVFSPAVSAARR